MPSCFDGLFTSDVPYGDVGAVSCRTGVFSCAAPLNADLPTIHYWVLDVSCIEDAAAKLRDHGYTDLHFTVYLSRSTWSKAYGRPARQQRHCSESPSYRGRCDHDRWPDGADDSPQAHAGTDPPPSPGPPSTEREEGGRRWSWGSSSVSGFFLAAAFAGRCHGA